MDSIQEEWLVCKKDNRQEALERDPDAVEVYKECSEDSSLGLVGHVLIEQMIKLKMADQRMSDFCVAFTVILSALQLK